MKRVKPIIAILAATLLLWFFAKILPVIYFNTGKAFFNDRDYEQAAKSFKISLLFDKKNKDTRYYYIQSLINLPPTLKVQKSLYSFSLLNLSDSADFIAKRQISLWRNQITQNIGENYIEQVPFNNKILRWDAKKFPIEVAFDNTTSNNLPPYYNSQIQKAFLQWQVSSENLVHFKFTDNPKQAQIIIKITSASDRQKCSQDDCKYTVAYTVPEVSGDLLKRMTITFYDTDNLSKFFSEREIYNTALHEIGHALGIMGHSYDKDSLMYMSTSAQTVFEQLKSDFQMIDPKDLNTLNLLYKLIPDITNTPAEDYDTSRQFFAPIVMGTPEQMNSRKILEAQNYINEAPNLPNGYIDLAAAYSEQKDYENTIKYLNKALELSTTDDEKYIVYYNIAITYMNTKNWDGSLEFAQKARQIKPDEEIDKMIENIKFNKKFGH